LATAADIKTNAALIRILMFAPFVVVGWLTHLAS
jgi:hypothetical protein